MIPDRSFAVKGTLRRRTYSFRLPGLVRGREHSAIVRAMKPRSGSASLALAGRNERRL